jgi:hypothetical protein
LVKATPALRRFAKKEPCKDEKGLRSMAVQFSLLGAVLAALTGGYSREGENSFLNREEVEAGDWKSREAVTTLLERR